MAKDRIYILVLISGQEYSLFLMQMFFPNTSVVITALLAHIKQGEEMSSIAHCEELRAKEPFKIMVLCSCLKGTSDTDVFSIKCADDIWRIPNLFELLHNFYPTILNGGSRINLVQHIVYCITCFAYYFANR